MTAGVLVAASCLYVAALFEPLSIDMPDPTACVFFAQRDANSTADVFVLTGRELNGYSIANGGAVCCRVTFEKGTSAFDVVDLDANGSSEIVAVCGDRVVRYELGTEPTTPTVLFQHHSLLSDTSSNPYPHVIVIERESKPFLALPLEDCVELRAPDGTLKESHAIEKGSNQDRFRTESRYPLRLGAPDTVETFIWREDDLSQTLPKELGSPEPVALRDMRTSRYYTAAGTEEYTDWPWFPLKTDQSVGSRVLHANPAFDRTLIRIYEGPPNTDWSKADWPSGEGVRVSGAKLYPGCVVVTPEALPDFNGDGYVDLVLRSTPEPELSVGSITRVVTGGSWPIHVTVHLFSPEQNRYEAKPFAKVSFRIPPMWFVVKERGIPMRNCVFQDFNGDGLSDCGWNIAENEFAVWLCNGADGFAEEPDWRYVFPEEGVTRELAARLAAGGEQGGTSLVFRGEKTLYVFVAQP